MSGYSERYHWPPWSSMKSYTATEDDCRQTVHCAHRNWPSNTPLRKPSTSKLQGEVVLATVMPKIYRSTPRTARRWILSIEPLRTHAYSGRAQLPRFSSGQDSPPHAPRETPHIRHSGYHRPRLNCVSHTGGGRDLIRKRFMFCPPLKSSAVGNNSCIQSELEQPV